MKHQRFGQAMTPQQYAENWTKNMREFNAKGEYKWMAEQLGQRTRILEVGCGSGESSLHLLKYCQNLLIVESNETCIGMTLSKLTLEGVSVCQLNQINDLTPSLFTQHRVILMHADITDAALLNQLPDFKFDAIVCWLIGTHPEQIASHLAKSSTTLVEKDIANYRESVQKHLGTLGLNCLNKSGVLHIVDRFGISSLNDQAHISEEVRQRMQELIPKEYEAPLPFLKKIEANLHASSISHLNTQGAHQKHTLVFSSIVMQLNQ